ncbi:MAG: serine/threonine-protein kinase, partial [Planctomycetota bacterium]
MKSAIELSASELARLDGVCLAFEKRLRSGKTPSIERWVKQFGGSHQSWLAEELLAISEELSAVPRMPAGSRESDLPSFPEQSTPEQNTPEQSTPARSLEATVAEAASSANQVSAFQSADNATKRSQTDSSIASDSPPTLEVETLEGQSMGPYKVVDRIGRGGMGVVYRAEDTRLSRVVAIKTLLPRLADREPLRQRFLRETQTVAAIRHPNIVEIHDCGTHEGLPYAVMEYLSGPALDEVLASAETMSPEEVLEI